MDTRREIFLCFWVRRWILERTAQYPLSTVEISKCRAMLPAGMSNHNDDGALATPNVRIMIIAYRNRTFRTFRTNRTFRTFRTNRTFRTFRTNRTFRTFRTNRTFRTFRTNRTFRTRLFRFSDDFLGFVAHRPDEIIEDFLVHRIKSSICFGQHQAVIVSSQVDHPPFHLIRIDFSRHLHYLAF